MRWIALVLACAACGGKKEASKQTAATDAGAAAKKSTTTDAASPTTPTNPTTPAADADEVVASRYYRAPGATAAFRYPELDDDQWTFALQRDDALPSVMIDFDDHKGGRARFQVMFPMRADTPDTAEALARQVAEATTEGATTLETKALDAKRYIVRVRAQAGDVTVVVAILAVVDAGASAVILATAPEAAFQDATLKQGYAQIIDGLAVGSAQPKPPAADPGTPLSGAYIHVRSLGGYDALVFDPRGYVHHDDAIAADLDAIWAIRDGKLDRYTFDGTKVAFGTHTGTLDHNKLTIDGDDYCNASSRVPARIAGHWELIGGGTTSANAYDTFSVHQSGDYYFTKDGGFGFSSFVSADLTNTQGANGPIKAGGVDGLGNPVEATEVHATGSGQDHGTYEIANDRLRLTAADGAKAVYTLYGAGCDADQDDRTGVLFIGGDVYLHDDSVTPPR